MQMKCCRELETSKVHGAIEKANLFIKAFSAKHCNRAEKHTRLRWESDFSLAPQQEALE